MSAYRHHLHPVHHSSDPYQHLHSDQVLDQDVEAVLVDHRGPLSLGCGLAPVVVEASCNYHSSKILSSSAVD